jgi:hypothetical protein
MRVIALPYALPAAPTQQPEHRNTAVAPSRAQATMGRDRQPATSSPADAALVALVRLLARQAAEEHMAGRVR